VALKNQQGMIHALINTERRMLARIAKPLKQMASEPVPLIKGPQKAASILLEQWIKFLPHS
jgi:hypothetical protein